MHVKINLSSSIFHPHLNSCLSSDFEEEMPPNPPKSSVLVHRINSIQQCNHREDSAPMKALQKKRDPLAIMPTSPLVPDTVAAYHTHAVGPNQCCSAVIQEMAAPVSTVWPVVRRFDKPQAYKNFVKSCNVIVGDGEVGTLREVHLISGLPAANSTERLEILDDERHIISFSVVGGEHRLSNYRSVTTLHPSVTTGSVDGTIVVESYVVDVPPGNSMDDTLVFVDTIVGCNLQSLAQTAENLARQNVNQNAGTDI